MAQEKNAILVGSPDLVFLTLSSSILSPSFLVCLCACLRFGLSTFRQKLHVLVF